jgi:hypothetical protein
MERAASSSSTTNTLSSNRLSTLVACCRLLDRCRLRGRVGASLCCQTVLEPPDVVLLIHDGHLLPDVTVKGAVSSIGFVQKRRPKIHAPWSVIYASRIWQSVDPRMRSGPVTD